MIPLARHGARVYRVLDGRLRVEGCGCDGDSPKACIQPLVQKMTKNYIHRLFRSFAADLAFIVHQLLVLSHKFVDEFTKKKLQIF